MQIRIQTRGGKYLMKIVTGYTGTTHVTADDDIFLNAGIFSKNDYVLELGNKFEAQIVDNNTIKILDGDMCIQGVHCRIENNSYDTISINNGQTGYKRIDLIVVEYTKTLAGVQNTQLKIIQGEAVTGTPEVPTATSGDILQGELLHQVPLYKVNIDGLSITSITPLFKTINNLENAFVRLNKSEAEQKILWSGGMFMTGAQTATLSEKISEQKNGIVLTFSVHSGSVQDWGFQNFFIPKTSYTGEKWNKVGFTFLLLGMADFNGIGSKYLYIYDDKLTGGDANTNTGTSSGISFKNNYFVLRAVTGV